MAAAAPPPPAEPTPEPTAAFSLLPAELALLSSLSVTEKLLVAQATYELGSQDFKGVAKLLQGHALLKERGKSFFSADKCTKVYTALMKELEMDPSLPYAVNAPELVKLARKYYFQRVGELHELMELEQIKFRIAYSEIDEIKAGKWDHKMNEAPAPPPAPETLPALPPLPAPSPPASTSEAPPTPTVKATSAPKAPVRSRKGTKGRKGRASAAKEVEEEPDEVAEETVMEVVEPEVAVGDEPAGESAMEGAGETMEEGGESPVDGAVDGDEVEGQAAAKVVEGDAQVVEEELAVEEDVEMAGL